MIKKIAAAVFSVLLIAAPVSAQTRTVRPFTDFALGLSQRFEELSPYLDANDWDTSAEKLSEMTIWIIEQDPEACYAGLWGVAAAFSAASAQLAIASAYSTDVLLITEMNGLLSEIRVVQEILTNGPALECF